MHKKTAVNSMINILKELIKEKDVLILGFGREGQSTFSMLKRVGGYKSISISDMKDVAKEGLDDIRIISGEGYLDCLDDFDVVFKSPGVVLKKHADFYKAVVTCQTEIFIQAFRENVIGITGTKGKSTTSSLLYHELKNAGLDCIFGGNIGIPVFDLYDEVKKNTKIILELSCHQLEYAKTSPHTALLLNVYEDHLDHYKTREAYARAKMNIYLHQKKEDILYTTKETELSDRFESTVEYISSDILPFKSLDELEDVKLIGKHNLTNCAFVYKVCKSFGISDEKFIDGLRSFVPLRHRLEPLGNFDGIDYYDDSISTTVASTIEAVESVKNSKVLLLGGMERDINYTELIKYLSTSKLDTIVCMYSSGERIYRLYEDSIKDMKGNHPKAVLVSDLEEAVNWVKKNAQKGGACLLSPAAASYGYFKNFEERGDFFRKMVAN